MRGIDGAHACTLGSIEKFLKKAPEYLDRLMVVSVLYLDHNFQSLLTMPKMLSSLGVRHWALGFELGVAGDRVHPIVNRDILADRLRRIRGAAEAEGIRCHVTDELSYFAELDDAEKAGLHACGAYDPRFWYRVDPLGYVRTGPELAEVWSAQTARRWHPPETDNAPETVGYWRSEQQLRSGQKRAAATEVTASTP